MSYSLGSSAIMPGTVREPAFNREGLNCGNMPAPASCYSCPDPEYPRLVWRSFPPSPLLTPLCERVREVVPQGPPVDATPLGRDPWLPVLAIAAVGLGGAALWSFLRRRS